MLAIFAAFLLFSTTAGDGMRCYEASSNVPSSSICSQFVTGQICASSQMDADQKVGVVASYLGFITEKSVQAIANERCGAIGGVANLPRWLQAMCSVSTKCESNCGDADFIPSIPPPLNPPVSYCCDYCKDWIQNFCGEQASTASCEPGNNSTMAFIPKQACTIADSCRSSASRSISSSSSSLLFSVLGAVFVFILSCHL